MVNVLKFLKGGLLTLVLALCLVIPQFVRAHEGTNMGQTKTSPQFDKIKQLVGTWEGSMTMHGQPMQYTVTYELIAGGSAVLEKLFVGSPHEMASVYYPEGNSVGVTHYCMLGNQPHMILQKSTDNTLSFNMEGTEGIRSMNESHMHHLTLTLTDENHMTAKWTEYVKGKKSKDVVLELTRKS